MTEAMSAAEIDDYLEDLDDPRRRTLGKLRRTILEIVPDAEQGHSYKVPAFRIDGAVIAGFAAFKNHLAYLPFSGSVRRQMSEDLDGYEMTKSSLHFPPDEPLSKALVRKLISVRRGEIDSPSTGGTSRG